MAKLYFRYGAMGSSKTANAIMVQYNYRERNQRVLMVKPQLENRDGARIIRSRSGLETECVFAEELEGMDLEGYDCAAKIEWESLTLQDITALSQSALLDAQTEKIRREIGEDKHDI